MGHISNICLIGAFLLLTACSEGQSFQTENGQPRSDKGILALFSSGSPVVNRTSLNGVLITAPDGYCIDSKNKTRSSVLLASCHVLSKGKSGADVEPVIMTVTVHTVQTGQAMPTASDIASSSQATFISKVERSDLMLVQLQSNGAASFPEADNRYWRAAFSLKNKSVGLALYARAGSHFSQSTGADILVKLHDTMRAL